MKTVIKSAAALIFAASGVCAGAAAGIGSAAVKAPETEAAVVYKAAVTAGAKTLQFSDDSNGPAAVTVQYGQDGRIFASLDENPVTVYGTFFYNMSVLRGQDRLDGVWLAETGGDKTYMLRLDGKQVPAPRSRISAGERVKIGGSVFTFTQAGDSYRTEWLFAKAEGALAPEEMRAFGYLMVFQGALALWQLNNTGF